MSHFYWPLLTRSLLRSSIHILTQLCKKNVAGGTPVRLALIGRCAYSLYHWVKNFELTFSHQTWNKPVNHFMRRHIYAPLVGRGWSNQSASIIVFTFSAILHE